jgi:hypothetical protein
VAFAEGGHTKKFAEGIAGHFISSRKINLLSLT